VVAINVDGWVPLWRLSRCGCNLRFDDVKEWELLEKLRRRYRLSCSSSRLVSLRLRFSRLGSTDVKRNGYECPVRADTVDSPPTKAGDVAAD
jgi:hypothetical protein